ncbi:MAG TPA: ubiquinol-cytochrome C chaperone family protein [Stellaceae bacterium]|nr:ubiquinol-cytochrome C chaperone family protein [Stellaceae bacterium]
MPLATLFRRNRYRPQAFAAYTSIVEHARTPDFFLRLDVPDTLDGRYEMIALHMFLVLNRLKAEHEETAEYAQALFDAMFADLDRGLREMGATDMGVGKRVKEMAKGLYGRIAAYEKGLNGDDRTLDEALKRNLYGTVQPRAESIAAVGRYMRSQAKNLARQPLATFLDNHIKFDPVTV